MDLTQTKPAQQERAPEKPDRRSLKDYFWLAVRGYAIGAADVVPGVSGGTMAFILGIYEELIHSIHAVDLTFIRRLLTLRIREAFADFPWRFLLALALGLATAVFTLAEVINQALHNYPVWVWSFFFGLVLASIFIVRKRVSRWTPATILTLLAAAVGAYLLVGMVPAQTPEAPWFLFLSGAIAVTATALPGISGAFVMVLLGKYHFLLDAVVNLDLLPLIIMASGAVVGLISFARVLRWLFLHYHNITIAALTGLMLGALRRVWPWKESAITHVNQELAVIQEINVLPAAFTPEVAIAIMLTIFGFSTVWLIDRLSARPIENEPL